MISGDVEGDSFLKQDYGLLVLSFVAVRVLGHKIILSEGLELCMILKRHVLRPIVNPYRHILVVAVH